MRILSTGVVSTPDELVRTMIPRSARESARTLPRRWIEEEWGIPVDGTAALAAHDGEPRKLRQRSAPSARRKKDSVGLVYHAYTGRRVSPGQQQQQQGPLRRRPLSGKIADRDAGDDYGGALDDSWGRGGGPRFARRGEGPRLEPPRPPKRPTRPRWPTSSVEASVLRYVETVRQEKGNGLAGAVPTVSWPEHAEMEKGDVVVTVEHCHGCHRHRMTTRHDPEVYLSHANAVKELLIESLRELPVRLAVVLKKSPLRSKTSPLGGDGGGGGSGGAIATTLRRRRVGALEVQVAARHPNRAHLLHAQVIHSKLASGRWPRLGTSMCLPNRLRRALESWGFETDRREIGGTRKDENSTDGAGADTPSAQHRPRPRVLIPWEFDHRDRMHRGDEVTTSPRQGARIPDKNPPNGNHNGSSNSRDGQRTAATGDAVATNTYDSHDRGSNEPTTSAANDRDTRNEGSKRRSDRSPESPGMTTTTRDGECSTSRGRVTEGTVAAGVLACGSSMASSNAAEVGGDSDAVVDGVATSAREGPDGKKKPIATTANPTTTIATADMPSSSRRREGGNGTSETDNLQEGIQISQTVAPEAAIHFGDDSFEAAGLDEFLEDGSAGGLHSYSNRQTHDPLSSDSRGFATRNEPGNGSCNNRNDIANTTSNRQTPASSITGESGHQLEPIPPTGQEFTSGVVRQPERSAGENTEAAQATVDDISDADRKNPASQPAVEGTATRGGDTREEQAFFANTENATDIDFHWESRSHSSCDRNSYADSTTKNDPPCSKTDGTESLAGTAREQHDSRTSGGGPTGLVDHDDSIMHSSSSVSNSRDHRGRAEVGAGEHAVGGPVRAEEGKDDISGDEDEYDSDFASQAEDSLVEEVDEDAVDAVPGPPPGVAPKEIESIRENDQEELEDAVWDQDEEDWEEKKEEEEEEEEKEVEEEEYGDDFDS